MQQDSLDLAYELLESARDGDLQAQQDLYSGLLLMTSEIHEVRRTSSLSPYHQKLLDKAEQWLDQRLPDSLLLTDPRDAAHAKWWAYATWTPEPVDGLSLYILASTEFVTEEKINSYIEERHTCRNCGESYRIENLQICTLCGTKLCYRCHDWTKVGRYHRCGGEMVG